MCSTHCTPESLQIICFRENLDMLELAIQTIFLSISVSFAFSDSEFGPGAALRLPRWGSSSRGSQTEDPLI